MTKRRIHAGARTCIALDANRCLVLGPSPFQPYLHAGFPVSRSDGRLRLLSTIPSGTRSKWAVDFRPDNSG